jgi:polar amino acid transport system substrate-binding protein
MAGTVGRTPERESYLIFIEPTYAKVPDQVFYLPTHAETDIQKYEDLYQLRAIGVERGARVSPRFDQDTKLKKRDIAELKQLVRMLDRGRLDAIAGNEMVLDYMIAEMRLQGKFRKASFRFVSGGMEFLAISRKSPHVKRLSEISAIIQKLKKNGKIQTYIDYYTRPQE